ncbi:12127_t:CDS:2, partial [Ambispora gerdemannii]
VSLIVLNLKKDHKDWYDVNQAKNWMKIVLLAQSKHNVLEGAYLVWIGINKKFRKQRQCCVTSLKAARENAIISVMFWPAQSPIENLWAEIKTMVHRRTPPP